MSIRSTIVILVICAVTGSGTSLGACRLQTLEFPITMVNMQPQTTAKINDRGVQFMVDSGAFYSLMSAASAAALNLPTRLAPFGMFVTGAGGGATRVSVADVKELTLAGVPLRNIEFLVGGNDISGSVGVLGQNVLHIWDVEYDLGQGAVRLVKPTDCKGAMLAYWLKPTDQLSVVDIERGDRQRERFFQTIVRAYVNGVAIRAELDTGAGVSTLSLAAAARAGVKPDSPGVVPAGISLGIGSSYESFIAPFSSFQIGGEKISNTRLRIGAINLRDADMLIGPDFFLAHRVYVANSEHRLYITYNGGPVFNLSGATHAVSSNSGDGGSGSPSTIPEPPAAPTENAAGTQDSGDAGDLSRRGQALASRRDFDHALADLTRACELAPDNPDYVYQRGIVHWRMKQTALALADFDRTIKLKPDAAEARIARAELKLLANDKEAAHADLDAADSAMPKQQNERFGLARLYVGADLPEPAVRQYDLWIAAHGEDTRVPSALNGRCWARALIGRELDVALKDCNAALRHASKGSEFYARVSNSRGLVYLRQGEYDRSIADYDAALKIEPKDPWSLYGRGVDKIRKQKSADGQLDLDQATAIWAQVGDAFKHWGISP